MGGGKIQETEGGFRDGGWPEMEESRQKNRQILQSQEIEQGNDGSAV